MLSLTVFRYDKGGGVHVENERQQMDITLQIELHYSVKSQLNGKS